MMFFGSLTKRNVALAISIALFCVCALMAATRSDAAFTEDSQYELGIRYGYGQTCKAHEKLYFNTVLPRWGVFLTQADNRILGKLRFSLLVEGLLGSVADGNTGWNIGFTPLLKISYPMGRVLTYIEGGAGIVWENIDSISYAHCFNFSPQIGAGVDIKIINNFALSLAYRFQHTSNAGLYPENPGVNSNYFMAGIAYYY